MHFTDEELDEQFKDAHKDHIAWNQTSFAYLGEMLVRGTIEGQPVQPRHRQEAARLIIEYGQWFLNTSDAEKQKQADEINERMTKMME